MRTNNWSRIHCDGVGAAVSWVRIERRGPADLGGNKATRAQTLSAAQLNSVSQGRKKEKREAEGIKNKEEYLRITRIFTHTVHFFPVWTC